MPRKALDGPERLTLTAAGGGLVVEPAPSCPTASAVLQERSPRIRSQRKNPTHIRERGLEILRGNVTYNIARLANLLTHSVIVRVFP